MKTRLQRFLADCGIASRRVCEDMILSGRVRVNGEVRTLMPVLIDPEKDTVTVDDTQVAAEAAGRAGGLQAQAKVYFLLNKPKGILVTTADPANRKTVGELLKGIKERVFPVGRLDMDARGALIMTNDGELANRLTHPRYAIEKTYIAEVDGRLGHPDLEKIKRGVWLAAPPPRHAAAPKPIAPRHDGPAAANKTERLRVRILGRERGRTILEIKTSEGGGGSAGKDQIRRIMARIGHTLRDLNRVAITGKITTKGLDPGEFRPLTESEVKWLFHASSPEFHAKEKASTQAWYEAKEMEKERKRLEKETEEERAAAKAEKAAKAARAAAPKSPRVEKEFRPRPERKGKKPFVPPTGRNAGVPLGGNYRGRMRLERESNAADTEPHNDTPPTENKIAHPLGDAAGSDE